MVVMIEINISVTICVMIKISDDIDFKQYLCIRNNPSFLHLPVQDFFFLHISYSSLQQPCEVGIITTL